jgi:hypothetical protein
MQSRAGQVLLDCLPPPLAPLLLLRTPPQVMHLQAA